MNTKVKRTAAYCLAVMLSLAAILAVCSAISGCANHTRHGSTAIQSESTSNSDIKIYTDDETGVQYLVYRSWIANGGAGGITPRLNPNGMPMVVR